MNALNKLPLRGTAIALGIAIIVLASALIVWVVLIMADQEPVTPPGSADRTNHISSGLIRPDNWEKIVSAPVVPVNDMFRIDGSTATVPVTAELLRQFYDYSDDQVDACTATYHSTTHNAYLNLIDKTNEHRLYYVRNDLPVDLIFVTLPSEEEENYALDKGVELDMVPVATDGFVFITHKKNPVDSLTVDQIRDIYSGMISNWSQVGGKDVDIIPFQREENSGSQTFMIQEVMKGKDMLPPVQVEAKDYSTEIVGMGPLIDAVAEYNNGPASIGYTYNYYIKNLYKDENIKVIKINGLGPDDENLLSGAYPFSTNYYGILRGDEPSDSPMRVLRDYLITPEGQDVIAMAGYCKAGRH